MNRSISSTPSPTRLRTLLLWLVLLALLVLPGLSRAESTVALLTGSNPTSVAVNPSTNRVYVANNGNNTISVIDAATNATVATVPVAPHTYGVAVNSSTNRIYVSNRDYVSRVSVIDGNTNTVVASIGTGLNPNGIAVNSITNRVYVANHGSNDVTVIDGSTNTVVATIGVGAFPYGIAVNPDSNRVYVTNANNGNSVSVIDGSTNTVVDTINFVPGSNPVSVAVNPSTNRVYVANYGSGSITVIDAATNTVVGSMAVGTNPSGVAVNASTNRVYVTNYNSVSNSVSVIDGSNNTVVGNIAVGGNPLGAVVNPNTNHVYVANYGSNNVSVLAPDPTQSSAEYTFTDLGTLGGVYSYPYAINGNGEVTGFANQIIANGGEQTRAFRWIPTSPNSPSGSLIDLLAGSSIANSTYSIGYDISDNGLIAGLYYGTANNLTSYWAFFYDTATSFYGTPYFGGTQNHLHGVNALGNMVGSAYNGSTDVYTGVYRLPDGSQTTLTGLGGNYTMAEKINDADHIVGRSRNAAGEYRPVLWNSPTGAPLDLGTLGGVYGYAYSIAETGRVVGYATTDTGQEQAFLWDDLDFMQGLGTLGGLSSRAYGINNDSQIVGESYTASNASWHAFVWDLSHGIRDLNDLILLPAGYTITQARSINDAGQIVGTVQVPTGTGSTVEHAFLLTPVPTQQLVSVTVDPAEVVGGTNSTGTVTLSQPVTGPVTVALASSDPAALVPASVTITSGTTATFPITTSPVATDTALTITGTYNGVAKGAVLSVLAPSPVSLTFSPSLVAGGSDATGIVTLDGPAPSDYVVTLTKTGADSEGVTLPASVTVPAGAISVEFTVTTTPVSADTTITVEALANAVSVTGSLVVRTPRVSSLSLSPGTVWGGQSTTGTVSLDGPAPAGYVVTVDAGGLGTVSPASLTVTQGETSATFTVATVNPANDTQGTVTATDPGGAQKEASLQVTAVKVTAVSITPGSVYGGGLATGTVTLNGPAPAGCTVTLSSSNSAVAQPQAGSVSVPVSASSVKFPITTSSVETDQTVTITGAYNGGSGAATLTVRAAQLLSLFFTPNSLKGGLTTTLTITLNGPAGPSGATVALSVPKNQRKVVPMPASVKVPAGQSKTTLLITTGKVRNSTSVTATGSYRSISRTATVTVTP